jgi:transposase-like protein
MNQYRDSESGTGGPTVARRPGMDVAIVAEQMGVSQSTVRRWIRSGRLNPNCVEVYARVDGYLDHELSEAERSEVQRHLEACPGCEEHFRFDGTVLRWVQAGATRTPNEPPVGRLIEGFRRRVGPATSDHP